MIACPRDCYDTCIFDHEHRPVSTFPVSGFTCSRGVADIKRNSLNRVEYPRIEGSHASLEDAVNLITRELRMRKPTEILHVDYDGNQGLFTWYFPARLWYSIHAATTDYSICSAEGHQAISRVYGSSFGATPEDFRSAKSFVIWGSDPKTSFIHGWRLMRGKHKVVIDVRVSPTAKESDRFFLIKPSSDAYLALGVIKSLQQDLPLNVKGEISTPWGTIEDETGITRREIEELADIYREMRPLTVIGFALGRTFQGGKAISLISSIPSLLGIERGFYYSNSGYGIDFAYLRGASNAPSRVIGMAEVYKEVERGGVTFMFTWNSNPLHSLPGSDRIVEAVKDGKLFLVVHDPFMSETARIANVVLPAPTYLEKEDVVYSYWHRLLVYNSPILPPQGIDEVTLMRLIAKGLNVTDPMVWEDRWEALRKATGVDLTELKGKGMARLKDPLPRKARLCLPELKPVPKGLVLVFGSHPNFTNSQFKEVYGTRDAVAMTHDLEGVGYLKSRWGRVRVRFSRDPSVPPGVVFMYKSHLFDLDGKPINSLVGDEKGEAGTPTLNFTLVEIEI